MASNHEIRSAGRGVLSDDQLGLLDMAGEAPRRATEKNKALGAPGLCFLPVFSSTGIKWRRTSPAEDVACKMGAGVSPAGAGTECRGGGGDRAGYCRGRGDAGIG